MKKALLFGTLALLMASGTALAEEKKAGMTPTPGEETRELEGIAADMKWEGKMLAGTMSPDSPEMPTKGTMNCKWGVNNLFLLCDIDGKIGADKNAMKWTAKFTVGWDFMAKEYRATMIDNMGSTTLLTGTVSGDKITLTCDKGMKVGDKMMKSKLIMDWSDPKAIQLIGERSIDDGPFTRTQEATMKPTKRHPLPASRAA